MIQDGFLQNGYLDSPLSVDCGTHFSFPGRFGPIRPPMGPDLGPIFFPRLDPGRPPEKNKIIFLGEPFLPRGKCIHIWSIDWIMDCSNDQLSDYSITALIKYSLIV